jgi:6-pyruvoyltetrahydropterin/6-carboxytetrahydropterin synthase
MYQIGKRFLFDAAHQLTGLPPEHKCSRLHGHTWTVEVIFAAETLTGPGFVVDFGELAPFGNWLAATCDHRNLSECLPVPATSEHLASYFADWIIEHLQPSLPGRLAAVRVSETPSSWAEYQVPQP